jgi:hypothetical protein
MSHEVSTGAGASLSVLTLKLRLKRCVHFRFTLTGFVTCRRHETALRAVTKAHEKLGRGNGEWGRGKREEGRGNSLLCSPSPLTFTSNFPNLPNLLNLPNRFRGRGEAAMHIAHLSNRLLFNAYQIYAVYVFFGIIYANGQD